MFIAFIASDRPGYLGVVLLLVVGLLTLPLFYLVHGRLKYCYYLYACRFCRNNGIKLVRWRCGPEFEAGGKTEYTIFDMDCLDAQDERRLIRLRVWIFGVRKVLANEIWAKPESIQTIGPNP